MPLEPPFTRSGMGRGFWALVPARNAAQITWGVTVLISWKIIAILQGIPPLLLALTPKVSQLPAAQVVSMVNAWAGDIMSCLCLEENYITTLSTNPNTPWLFSCTSNCLSNFLLVKVCGSGGGGGGGGLQYLPTTAPASGTNSVSHAAPSQSGPATDLHRQRCNMMIKLYVILIRLLWSM